MKNRSSVHMGVLALLLLLPLIYPVQGQKPVQIETLPPPPPPPRPKPKPSPSPPKDDRAAIFAIDQVPRLELGLDTAARATSKLISINPAKSATAFYDTVIEAARYLAKSAPPEHRRVILVISDGEDNFSDKIMTIGNTREEQDSATPQARRLLHHRMLVEVQRELQKADAEIYSINHSGPGLRFNIISQRAQDGMEQLATSTGGTSFVPGKLEDLDAVFRQIAAELRSQYLLQYYSKSEAASGTFLGIGVQVPKRLDLRIRARQGYYVKRK